MFPHDTSRLADPTGCPSSCLVQSLLSRPSHILWQGHLIDLLISGITTGQALRILTEDMKDGVAPNLVKDVEHLQPIGGDQAHGEARIGI